MAPEVIISTGARHTLALALLLSVACADTSAHSAKLSSDGEAAHAEPLIDSGDDDEDGEPACVFDLNALLARAEVHTAPRVDCGGFRASALSTGNPGSVDCFLQQSLEKQTAV
ncbi:MAG TPA: hypothetical protein VMF89_05085, partial [Polyangiales bacterium]|nr:hypothetical protein [Polyangiales bacterium]